LSEWGVEGIGCRPGKRSCRRHWTIKGKNRGHNDRMPLWKAKRFAVKGEVEMVKGGAFTGNTHRPRILSTPASGNRTDRGGGRTLETSNR